MMLRVYDKVYTVTKVCCSEEEANHHLEQNPSEGVIAEVEGLIFIANNEDKGEMLVR